MATSCGGDDKKADPPATTTTSTSTTTTEATTTTTAVPVVAATAPLTGLPIDDATAVKLLRPALAVKIDNSVDAMPQEGLNQADIVPADFVLSDKNIADVQRRMPNRNGMTTDHGLWPGAAAAQGGIGNGGKPDAKNTACMSNCATEPTVKSFLPDFARNAHGNLAEQNRMVGPQRGANTLAPEAARVGAGAAVAAPPAAVAATPSTSSGVDARAAQALAQKHTCTACHAADRKLVGPSWADIAKKHAGSTDYLAGKIKSGGTGVWGAIPMPPQTLPDADAKAIAAWLAAGAGKQ